MHSINAQYFQTVLSDQYRQLFETPAYAVVAAKTSPEALAAKMLAGLADGSADKSGEGVVRACKALGIKHTYKAIAAYLAGV